MYQMQYHPQTDNTIFPQFFVYECGLTALHSLLSLDLHFHLQNFLFWQKQIISNNQFLHGELRFFSGLKMYCVVLQEVSVMNIVWRQVAWFFFCQDTKSVSEYAWDCSFQMSPGGEIWNLKSVPGSVISLITFAIIVVTSETLSEIFFPRFQGHFSWVQNIESANSICSSFLHTSFILLATVAFARQCSEHIQIAAKVPLRKILNPQMLPWHPAFAFMCCLSVTPKSWEFNETPWNLVPELGYVWKQYHDISILYCSILIIIDIFTTYK